MVPIRVQNLENTPLHEPVKGGLPRAARQVVPVRSANGATSPRFMGTIRDNSLAIPPRSPLEFPPSADRPEFPARVPMGSYLTFEESNVVT